MGYIPCPKCDDALPWEGEHICRDEDIIERIEDLEKRNRELEVENRKYGDLILEIIDNHAVEIQVTGKMVSEASFDTEKFKWYISKHCAYLSILRWGEELFTKQIPNYSCKPGTGKKITRLGILEELFNAIQSARRIEKYTEKADMTMEEVIKDLNNETAI